MKLKLVCYLLLAACWLLKPDVSYAISGTDSLYRVLQQTTDIKEKTEILTELASLNATRDFDAAIEEANRGMLFAAEEHDSLSMAKLYRIRGQAQYFKGSYATAAADFYRSIAILERHGGRHELAYTFNELAKLYRKTRELDRAIYYYDASLNLFEAQRDTAGIQMAWNESGVVFEYSKDYKEALRRYRRSLGIAESRKDSLGIGYALNNIAGLFVLEGKYREAEQYLLQCLALRTRMRDSFAMALTYSDMGSLYSSMKDYGSAIRCYMASNSLAIPMKYAELQATNYRELAGAYQASGNYKEAYRLLTTAQMVRDSIFSIEKAKQISELNTRYQTEKKEQQLLVQAIELSRKNYVIGAILVILGLICLLGYSGYRRYRLNQENRFKEAVIRQQDIATRAVLEAEEKERQRIAQDLHDGVGQMMSAVKLNLSAFQSELKLEDPVLRQKFGNIYALVDDSCREVRAVSHQMMPNALLKSGLSAAIREFLNRIDSSAIEINLYIEGMDSHLDKDVEIMLYRVVQECVSNVVKHAAATRLDITIIRETISLTATIEDNGQGFDQESDVKGIGLETIRSRVEYLKGTLEIDSAPGRGTVITIFVPLS